MMPTDLIQVNANRAEIIAQDNDAMMRHRIENEFAGADPNTSITKANETLTDICDYERQNVELMKQELEVLKSILSRLSVPVNGIAPGDTSANSRPSPPSNYYAFSVRPMNSPNFGGTENLTRG